MNKNNLPITNQHLWMKRDSAFYEEFDIMNGDIIIEYFYRWNMKPMEYIHSKVIDGKVEGIYMVFNNL